MSTVVVLTPLVVASWPIVASAVVGAAGAMGFSIASARTKTGPGESVETEVPNSEVIADTLARGEELSLVRDGITVTLKVDDRGRVSVCASGHGVSKAKLKAVGEEVSGRIVQQFAYHKLMNELKTRGFSIEQESVQADASIQIRVTS
jgi:hypothetical protein